MIAAQLSQALFERAAESCTRAREREELANGFAEHGFGEDASEARNEERIQRAVARHHSAEAAVLLSAANHVNGASPE